MTRWLWVLSLWAMGCGSEPPAADAGAEAAVYALSMRPVGGGGGDGGGVELRQGFQGFRYTRVVLVAGGDAPAQTPGVARLEIEGFDPAEQRFRSIALQPLARGYFESEPLLVYANDVTLARAVGRRATLRFVLDDGRHRATATREGPVRWDPHCVEDADFRCLPPSALDGGAP